MIQLRHVTVRRNRHLILDDISLDIEKGQHTAVIGPNGAGKSTLIKVLTKDMHPIQHEELVLKLYGKETWHILDLKNRLGIITPDLQRICHTPYSAEETILSGFFSSIGLFHLQHTVTPRMKETMDETAAFLSISHLLKKPMNTLSSGEARKILIARALIHNPESMLLDEPSSNLDLPAGKELRRILDKLAEKRKTIILISHDLADILPRIKRLVCIRDGKIIAEGSKEELLTESFLSELYGTKVYLDHRNGFYKAWC